MLSLKLFVKSSKVNHHTKSIPKQNKFSVEPRTILINFNRTVKTPFIRIAETIHKSQKIWATSDTKFQLDFMATQIKGNDVPYVPGKFF